MRRHLIFLLVLLVLPLVAFIAVPHVGYAETGLKIQPVKISETLTPGQSTSGTISLTNVSDSDVNVSFSVDDFVPLAGADTIQFVDHAAGITSVRDWITIDSPKSFVFKKDESRTIGYTINAPQNAEPGGHFGVVLFKATPPGQGTLQIGTQVGMLVLVAIPGSHTESGKILDFSTDPFVQAPPVHFVMHFENTGTVHFEPRGNIIIRDLFGRQVGDVPLQGVTVLPSSIKKIEYDWNVRGFLIGRYTATATIVDGEGTTLTSATVSFWIVPIWYALAFIVILAVIFFLIRFLKRRVKISVALK